MDVLLDFICMGPVNLSGARRKRQNTRWNILVHGGTRTHNPEISSLMLYRLSSPGLSNDVHFNDFFTYMYSQYQCIHVPCYKYENDEVERNLSCKCTVLCYILEYIYIVQITKRRISHVLAFNMHLPDQVECLVVFACWNQAQDLCVSLLFVQYLYIYIAMSNTKQYHNIYQTKYAALHHSRTYNNVYILSRVHACNKVISTDNIQQARLAQSVEHQTWNLRVVSSSLTVGKNFSFCILSLLTGSWQVDWSHVNEIKQDVHPRYIGA